MFCCLSIDKHSVFFLTKKDEDHICAIIGSAGRFRLSSKLSYYPLSEPVQPADVLAQQPGAVRSAHHVVLEDKRLQPTLLIEKELVSDFRNNGREYRPHGCPEEVRVHDFLIKELGRAVPYGVYATAPRSSRR